MKKKIAVEPASFRDPSGQVFYLNGQIYRQINISYKDNYDYLIASGLYKSLTRQGLLIAHQKVSRQHAIFKAAYKVLKPQLIPFLSYPYEWCFSQLKDAALTTIKAQKTALKHGMSLKDASAYNIQFVGGKPILIDTLSFEKYQPGKPWVAYRQFCQHFLAPLSLMSYTDVRLNQLLKLYIDGLPLDLTSKLLPKKTWLDFSLLSHLHLHAKSQQYFANRKVSFQKSKIKKGPHAIKALINNLESTLEKLKWRHPVTEWSDYYTSLHYSKTAWTNKKGLVDQFLDKVKPKTVWDLGANIGEFSRMAAKKGAQTIAFDYDPVAVEKNYLGVKRKKEKNILPLLGDLTNPSPSLGWENQERKSLLERGPADTVLALALVHHLAIGNNLPLVKIAQFFAKISHSLIIEFVPKSDSQVQKLLATREDIFSDYTKKVFEKEFSRYFSIKEKSRLKDSERILYLMTQN